MSDSEAPRRHPIPPEVEKATKIAHNVALVALVACPLLAVLPPRKLDLYTFTLFGLTGFSANHLIQESSGRSIWQHVVRQQRQPMAVEASSQGSPVLSEVQKQARESAADDARALQSQREAWKVQREKEIKEDVEEGKGFGDMIMDQIWEVWNQGKVKEEEDED
ncbi:uncharacterized protein MYCGRDRAFT_103199, partial [Zymoseptoria tritici IPO323]